MAQITMLEAIREALFEEMDRDPGHLRPPKGCSRSLATSA
jgi:hypothetical protein